MEKQLDNRTIKLLIDYQKAEVLGWKLYSRIASRLKDEHNKEVLMRIADQEKEHAETLAQYTNQDIRENRFRLFWYTLISYILGYTFSIKLLESTENLGIEGYRLLEKEIPEIPGIISEEERHEDELLQMLDEERLQYVGSMVLGLNDALVELTGAIAGLTFALAHTQIVALSGIITGISATLSMAASNYLAERADGNPKALKSSFYTGIAYLVTVVLMVTPYLLFPNSMYIAAFATMIAIVIIIIAVFNYYISVAKSFSFKKRFFEMAGISLGVAVIAFIIGLIAKALLGIDVA